MDILVWVNVTADKFNTIPRKYGVYLIVAKCTDNRNWVVYSGQSSDLQERINQHWDESEPNKGLKNAISKYGYCISVFYAVANGNSVDGYERYLKDMKEKI